MSVQMRPSPRKLWLMAPDRAWLWSVPFMTFMVWSIQGMPWPLAGRAELLGLGLAALLGAGLTRPVVVPLSESEITRGLRLYYGFANALWFGCFMAVGRGTTDLLGLAVNAGVSGGMFGALMAAFLKPFEAQASLYEPRSVFERGGWLALWARLWPWVAVLSGAAVLLLGGNAQATLLALLVMMNLAPDYRRVAPDHASPVLAGLRGVLVAVVTLALAAGLISSGV